MKKGISLLLILLFITCSFLNSQTINSPAISITQVSDASKNQNGYEGILGAQCIGGIVYDDNTFENAYGWTPSYTVGKYVMKLTPTTYPYTFNQVCLALTRTSSGSANFTFDIVVYDTTGISSSPGNLLATIPNQTAANVPLWPTVSWFDFTGITGIPQIISGSYYIGISWNPAAMPFHFIGADENSAVRIPGYSFVNSTWSPISNSYSGYKKIGVRADGAPVIYTHNIAAGPFLSLPAMFISNISYPIKAKISNYGTSNESSIPVKFFVDNVQINSINIALNSGQADSVSFNWTAPATGYYNLKIVSALPTDEHRANDTVSTNVLVYPAGVMNCIGNGTIQVGYPFYTYYMDSKTDMLYLASEIGIGTSTNLYSLGFNVVSAAPQVMNGFVLKMKNTLVTSINTFELSGWTTVYNGSFAITNTGWQFITFQAPFLYTGGNLLIEICYNNSSWTQNSIVTSTTKSGRVFHAHQDLSTGNGCTDIISGALQASLPNICLSPWVGIDPNTKNGIPEVYSLKQNYPNPFNPTTTIQYQIPLSRGVPEGRGISVKLTIFDALGRNVALLVNEKQSAGSYSIEWDGTNYSSGLYFYKLECDGFTDVKKMVLIK